LYEKKYIGLISIDECHCIVEWGYDFRPEYLNLSNIKKWIPNIPILCLTATATDDIKNVIIKKLQLNNPKIVKNSFDRKNLTIYTKNFKNQNDILSDIVPLLDNSKCIIIYTREKKETLLIYNKINNEEFKKIKNSKLQDIIKFANINKFCKKIYLYKYFNEQYPEDYKNSKYGCNKCNYCKYIYKKGKNKGYSCKKFIEEDNIYCKIHIPKEENKVDIIDKFNNMKLQELRFFCKNNNIHNYSKLRKDELIKYIINTGK
jgi:superfamily II DNA helicase RecQ